MAAVTVRELRTVLSYKLNESGLKGYNKQLQGVKKKSNAASEATRNLARTARRMIGVYAGFRTVKGLINVTGDMRQLREQVKLAIKPTDDLNTVIGELSNAAKGSDTTIKTQAQRLQLLSNALKNSGKSTKEIIHLQELLSKGMTASNTSAAGQKQIIERLSKTISTRGYVDQSTFNALAKFAPTLAKTIRKGLGLTQEEFEKALQKHEITGKQFFAALSSEEDTINQHASQITDSVGTAFSRLTEQIGLMGAKFEKNTGIVQKLADVMHVLADHATAVVAVVGTLAGAFAFTQAIKGVKGLVGAIGDVHGAIKSIQSLGGVAKSIGSWLSNPYVAIAGALVLLAVLGAEAAMHWGAVTKFFGELGEKAKDAFSKMGEALSQVFKSPFYAVVNFLIKSVNDVIGIANKIPFVDIQKIQKLQLAGADMGKMSAAKMHPTSQHTSNSTQTDNSVNGSHNTTNVNITTQPGADAQAIGNETAKAIQKSSVEQSPDQGHWWAFW